MGYYIHISSFLSEQNILNSLENSGLKSTFLFCLIFQFYLMYRLICQKPAHFLSAQIVLVSAFFFQMFIALGMYNFECTHRRKCVEVSKRFLYLVVFLPSNQLPTLWFLKKIRAWQPKKCGKPRPRSSCQIHQVHLNNMKLTGCDYFNCI